MAQVLMEIKEPLSFITLNRTEKHNAFDDLLIKQFQESLDSLNMNDKVRVIIIKANGSHFSAGADLAWMQRMVSYTQAQNQEDALIFAKLINSIYTSSKPTIALVQGSAFGGGVGIAAACDFTIAATDAHFCFSEVKLGLIPAVISPYVIEAIGAKAAKWLFMSGEIIDAETALRINLIQHCIPGDELEQFSINFAEKLLKNAPVAIMDCKNLVQNIHKKNIDQELIEYTATLIAKKRVSAEAQKGLKSFLNKQHIQW